MDNQTEQSFLVLVTTEVTKAIAQALETLIHEKGFEVPIFTAAIGSNGYTYAVKYQQKAEGTGLEAKELAEHAPDEEDAGFPINLLFVDWKRSMRARQGTNVRKRNLTLQLLHRFMKAGLAYLEAMAELQAQAPGCLK